MDPTIITKTGAGAVKPDLHVDPAPKAAPSKFDQLLNKPEQQQAPPVEALAAVKNLQPASQPIAPRTATAPREIFSSNMDHSRSQLDQLQTKVEALPKSPSLDAVKKRLSSIEGQFTGLNASLQGAGPSTAPTDLLQMQMQVYKMSEDIEIVSKVVDQLSSGAKSVLQMQV